MTVVSQNVYYDVLDSIVDKYHNTYHNTINVKLIVKYNSCAEYNVDSTTKNPKFKIGDYVTVSKYKNIFAEGYTPNWSEKYFVISKVKNTIPWECVIMDPDGEEIVATFYEKELQRLIKKNLE